MGQTTITGLGAVASLLLGVAVGCSSDLPVVPDPDPTPAQLDGFSGRPTTWGWMSDYGRRVRVRYVGGACESSRATVEEAGGRVVITVYVKQAPGMCISIAKAHQVAVHLDAPLGRRPVYDGACLTATKGHPTEACLRTPS